MLIFWILIGFGFLVILQKTVYSAFWNKKITVKFRFSKRTVTEGEPAEIFERSENRKLLPLPVFGYSYTLSRSFASVGVEIFPEERRKGYAAQGMKLVFEIAKGRGYMVIQDQVAADNGPSIALHEKLGFETDGYEYTNKRDRRVILYSLCL